MIYKFLILISVSLLCSCGTIKSLNTSDNEVEINHYLVKTNCEEISHIYSGVQYDLCLLNSERKSVPSRFQLGPLWLTSVDILLSAVTDTVVLPYTIYQQVTKENLKVAR